jgi:hypothetical protein
LHLVEALAKKWGTFEAHCRISADGSQHTEAVQLRLSCDKANTLLRWTSVLTFDEVIELTADWYKLNRSDATKVRSFSASQIETYESRAAKAGQHWAHPPAIQRDGATNMKLNAPI